MCHGDPKLCRFATCPKLAPVRSWYLSSGESIGQTLYGPTPPGAFVGEWGYPRVQAGPLVPVPGYEDAALLDAPERWLGYTLEELLRFRLSMVRGRAPYRVPEARGPDRNLMAVQEAVMASRPTAVEVQLEKPPNLDVTFSPRSAPVGPSAPLARVVLTENPSVPRRVDAVVSDTDLRAGPGILELYRGGITQSHITKLLSVGLLGVERDRRLVPTEWSITATDDILGRALRQRVLQFPHMGEYRLFSHGAVANQVHILLLPTPWMYEALEAFLVGPDVWPAADHEFAKGRKDYPRNLAGAYHAARLPVLEYLEAQGRQAGAVVFLEVRPEWIPLGVWRFREIAREALRTVPFKVGDLKSALAELSRRLELPLERWLQRSRILDFHRRQTRLEAFHGSPRLAP